MIFKQSYKFLLAATLLSCCLFGCTKIDVYEKNTPIPNYQWQSNFTATGSLEISDTSSYYNIFIVLRHTDGYKYNNIWLNTQLFINGDTILNKKIDVPLGTDANGWDGIGMTDIWELRKPIFNSPKKFPKQGLYQFNINQIMRDNPLPNVMSAGLRIEKIKF
jgi:gliding motility-associated lipoprotein GldH